MRRDFEDNLDNPENNRVYRVGVHYFNDHDGGIIALSEAGNRPGSPPDVYPGVTENRFGFLPFLVSEASNTQSESGYTLRVTGGSCVPWLDIAKAPEQKVVLTWPNFAADFHLHATSVVQDLTNCLPVLGLPFVIGGECVLTNPITPFHRFYELHKP